MSQIVQTLITKHTEIVDLIADLERQIARHRADLVHIDGTIALFDPTMVSKTGVKGSFGKRSPYFANGELSRRCREIMRDAVAPMTVDDMAIKMIGDKGLDVGDKAISSDITQRILWTMKRLKRDGKVLQIGSLPAAKWALLPVEDQD